MTPCLRTDLAALCLLGLAASTPAVSRPHILWLTAEDIGPHLGCYGDPVARTPNLDALAADGVRHTAAWSTHPVCAPARTAIITGMYPASTGGEHMRSLQPLPEHVRMFPAYLREAGYYCTNNNKQDYNHPPPGGTWDESSAAKWCNARSEFEGLLPCYYTDAGLTNVYREDWLDPATDCVEWQADGYRLPTEAEWEKAARGGRRGIRFPWGSTIDHSRANHQADGSSFEYDARPYSTWTPHPDYGDGTISFTSPVGSFAANGYGIHDTSGNVWEWCWDVFGFYSPAHATDPQFVGVTTLSQGSETLASRKPGS